MSKYKLGIFDLDGVLTETSEQHYQAWKVMADELGLSFDREMNEQLKGISRMASFEVILRENHKTEAFSEDEKLKLITRKNEIYKSMIQAFTPENLFEGVSALFAYMKKLDMKIALASASHNGPTLLDKMGVADLFDVVVNPGEVKHGKPAPDIFLAAAEKLGIDPLDCIGFEDAVAGVSAIKQAGMFAVGIGDAGLLKEADIVFKEMKDFDYSLLDA